MKGNHYDVIVIGAGQAGLAAGYYLSKENVTFIILDASETVGETWRKRYDSLVLFTPRSFSSLPGLPLSGEPQGFPTKDELANYLAAYAKYWRLPVQTGSKVLRLFRQDDGRFYAETATGIFSASKVIVATGPFQYPSIPHVAAALPEQTLQLHSSDYINPSQLKEGPVLVVGGGNSGAQIAVELAKSKRVYLAVGHALRFLPLRIGPVSIFSLFKGLGLLSASKNSVIGKRLKERPDPIFGYELLKLTREGRVVLMPRVVGYQDDKILFEHNRSISVVPNVIWSTGFRPNYDWMKIDKALNRFQEPIQNQGVSPVKGLYYVGLPWQRSRGSALVGGVGMDAQYVVSHIIQSND